MDDPTDQGKAGRPRNSGGQDLYGLGAVVKLRQYDSPNDSKPIQSEKGVVVTNAQPRTKRIQQRLTVIPARDVPQIGLRPASEPADARLLPARQWKYGGIVGFVLCVIVPIALSSIYYAFIASDQYVTGFRFTVRDGAPSASANAAVGGIMNLLGSPSGTVNNDNYLVTDYLTSRQVVDELQDRINLVGLYAKPDIDWWSRFNASLPKEKFNEYWQKMVNARFDMVTGIATAEVRAFSANDAFLIANTMVQLSEELINKIAYRSQNDAVRFATQELEKAQNRLRNARTQLTEYRNKFGIIDPNTSVAASNSSLVLQQRANLSQLEMQLGTLQSQNLSPNAPAVVTLKNQINSTREQLERTEADVAKGRNGFALSKIVGEFEQLSLEVTFSQAMVTSAMTAFEQARANAAAQHMYITPFVRPSLPQSSTYPDRFLSVLRVAGLAFAFWIVALLLVRSIRERFG